MRQERIQELRARIEAGQYHVPGDVVAEAMLHPRQSDIDDAAKHKPTAEWNAADDFLCRWYITMDSTRAEDDIRIDLAQLLTERNMRQGDTDDAESGYNALLIAAAPDLYAALHDAYDWVCELLPDYATGGERLDVLRTALHKAEGRDVVK